MEQARTDIETMDAMEITTLGRDMEGMETMESLWNMDRTAIIEPEGGGHRGHGDHGASKDGHRDHGRHGAHNAGEGHGVHGDHGVSI
jgi:hypothetical protein